ncbi:MAG: DUF5716 family protein [Acetatifactor sp.]
MGFFSGDKVIVGFDLGNEFSQISYSRPGTGEVETISQTAGAENYSIPTVLCKRSGVNQWFYGKEAVRKGEEEQGITVDNLLALAIDGEPVLIDGESFDPVALLTLFVKRCLGMLSQVASADKIEGLMITCEVLDHNILEILNSVAGGLRLKTDNIFFQSHTESYYYYMIHQPRELWMSQSLLFAYAGNCIKVYRMDCNRKTTPMVAYIEEKAYPFPCWEPLPLATDKREKKTGELDIGFLKIVGKACEGTQAGSVFLIGDGFGREWMKESLKYLCRNRRVFQGNNLFSKGACLGMQERLNKSAEGSEYIFLGNDKLKANIGMNILRQGEETYLALLDAGVNWYEAAKEFEFYLQDGNEITFIITPLVGKAGMMAQVVLEELTASTVRMRVRLFLEAENTLVVELEDLGLGELKPASGRVWREKITLY